MVGCFSRRVKMEWMLLLERGSEGGYLWMTTITNYLIYLGGNNERELTGSIPWVHLQRYTYPVRRLILDPFSNEESISPSTRGIFPYVMGVRPAPPRFRLDFASSNRAYEGRCDDIFWHWSFHIVDDYSGHPNVQEISQESSDLIEHLRNGEAAAVHYTNAVSMSKFSFGRTQWHCWGFYAWCSHRILHCLVLHFAFQFGPNCSKSFLTARERLLNRSTALGLRLTRELIWHMGRGFRY